ncbi:methylthioadenosine phosphorylase isoform X2 [Rhodnius prolixus]|uniref:S-methyl-5'-thioadenosine phosphorylase n=2 Tax=Rhodnius TaxID=13248 RepID=R4G8P7_RHOPR
MAKVKIGIIGGSGLDDPQLLKNVVENHIKTPYGPTSDALLEGQIEGIDCVVLARHGRKHSVSPTNVNYRANIWALKKVGCTHVIVSTATGSLREEIAPGDLVVIDSFIDRTKHRVLTFFDGTSEEFPGVCHIPMEPAFCEDTRKLLINVAKELKLKVHESGTAICIEGPRFSTKAESNLFRTWGASLVNMTLVPEVILAKEAGLCYAAVAIATDYDCWRGSVVDVDEVEAAMKKYAKNIKELFLKSIPIIAKLDWSTTITELKSVVKKGNMHKEKN